MARGPLKHPKTPASLTAQGVTRKEYCAFLDLVEHHKQRAQVNRATGLQPGQGNPTFPGRPAPFIGWMKGWKCCVS